MINLFTATPNTPAHAKSRPPSAALRWINCPASVNVVPLYPNDSSEHSDKGDAVHKALENNILFGIVPDTSDPDADLNVAGVMEWIGKRKAEYGDDTQVFAEQRYDICETGEYGTCDITLLSSTVLHIADYKNGFVMTEAYEQMMVYLLGAIAKFGVRDKYYITVIQPNFDHRDGPYRTTEISHTDVEAFKVLVDISMHSHEFIAGDWCKKSYCEHRGSCATLQAWAKTTGADVYYPHEINAISDAELSTALDHSDVLHGIRDEHRKEAMRRISQHDRKIAGYKLVKSRQNRDFAGETGREQCYLELINIGYTVEDLYERKPFKVGGIEMNELSALTVPGVERMVKQQFKRFGNGKWKLVWDQYFKPHIREFSGSLTLVRETDGRPSHSRGSEFGALLTPTLRSSIVL